MGALAWAPFREERAGSTAHACARLSACPLSPVIYNGCPRAFEAGIWWPQTKFGQPAAVPCPKGSVGKYHGKKYQALKLPATGGLH